MNVQEPKKYKVSNFDKSLLFYCWLNNTYSFWDCSNISGLIRLEISEYCKQLLLIKKALNKESLYEISVKLDEKFSRSISYSSQIVFFQFLCYTCFSGTICQLQVSDFEYAQTCIALLSGKTYSRFSKDHFSLNDFYAWAAFNGQNSKE